MSKLEDKPKPRHDANLPDSGCCSSHGGISKVYLLNHKDCVFEDDVLVRLKRKYGKYKREVVVVDYNSR